jgi:CubicO group peptidase (beta-lactamase class C family)
VTFRTALGKIIMIALTFLVFSARPASAQSPGDPPPPPAERIHRIENGLPPIKISDTDPPLQLSLANLMEMYKVPGLSIAVIDNYKIAWAKAYGVTEAGATTPVTPRTLFMAGSIAKTPTAAAALYLVQHGKLSLDQNVNEQLKSWKVPENNFTAQQKVTLRRILSHTAGTTVHGFPGYESGDTLPTLVQILNGEDPANSPAVRVIHIPGTEWNYSGGGVLIEQQLMIDVTGKPFTQLMREILFDKIGMQDSTYQQPLPADRAAHAASGTYSTGFTVEGKWHIYPEMAAGGLWTTPSDLARFAIEVALSKHGKSNRVLSQSTAQEMLKPQFDPVKQIALGDAQHPDRMGLGFFLGDATRPDLFGHIGDDEGFQAMLVMFADSGQGAVIMANSENGILFGDFLIAQIAKEYGWKNYLPPNRPEIGSGSALRLVAREKGIPAAIEVFRRMKKENARPYTVNQETLISLAYELYTGHKVQDAIAILDVEIHEFPQYWNAYDSLGELYADTGDTQRAIQNYEKSVQLKPDNQGGIAALKKLKSLNK